MIQLGWSMTQTWMVDDPIWMIDDPTWMIDDPTWMVDDSNLDER
jgi:hypothetical protein